MPFKIVRNDITKMNTDAIVNTANDHVSVGTGCDHAVYTAAGYDELLSYREKIIGFVPEGDAFITPGFKLAAKYIIHAVSPFYVDGTQGEEEKLRSCYRKSLELAKDNDVKSIAFPLISTGAFGYPKEEGIRIAVDEFNAFLLNNEMLIYLVVFDTNSTRLGEKLYPSLQAYIDHNYVKAASAEEYDKYPNYQDSRLNPEPRLLKNSLPGEKASDDKRGRKSRISVFGRSTILPKISFPKYFQDVSDEEDDSFEEDECFDEIQGQIDISDEFDEENVVYKGALCPAELGGTAITEDDLDDTWDDEIEELDAKLKERLKHKSDTFSQYLLYLINSKGMSNVEVYTRAFISKKTFSKIKNNIDYHPEKITALCLCVGAKLNLDETKDLLARAGYALSPSDLTDIIFSFFIENEHHDVLDIDIKIEEYGLDPIIQ